MMYDVWCMMYDVYVYMEILYLQTIILMIHDNFCNLESWLQNMIQESWN